MSGRIVKLTREEYDQEDRANWSVINAKSPAHMLLARKQTKAMRDGWAAHLAILEPNDFSALPVYDGIRRGKEWEGFKAQHGEAQVLTAKERDESAAIAEAVHARWKGLFDQGEAEVSILWDWEGIPCKSRLDFLGRNPVTVLDVKTVQDASPEVFGAQVGKAKTLGQVAMYADAVLAATGEESLCCFLAVERAAPYVSQLYTVDHGQFELGRAIYQRRLKVWDKCRLSGEYPGYSDGSAIPLVLPAWGFSGEE